MKGLTPKFITRKCANDILKQDLQINKIINKILHELKEDIVENIVDNAQYIIGCEFIDIFII
mgnify:CR=1 FL=1